MDTTACTRLQGNVTETQTVKSLIKVLIQGQYVMGLHYLLKYVRQNIEKRLFTWKKGKISCWYPKQFWPPCTSSSITTLPNSEGKQFNTILFYTFPFALIYYVFWGGGFTSLSTTFQSYRDGVWMWPGAQCSHLVCCLTEISRPRNLRWYSTQSHYTDTELTSSDS